MSDFSSGFFELDDGEDDDGSFGGFDAFDASEIAPIEEKQEDEPEEKEDKTVEPEPEKPDPVDNTAYLVGVIAKQTEQINHLMEAKKDPEVEPPPLEKPEFTAEQWETNPAACTEALYTYHRESESKSQAKAREQEQKQAQERTNKLQEAHNTGWATVLDVVPELNTNEPTALRNLYAQYFESVKSDPMGTIKALKALKADPRAQELLKPPEDVSATITPGKPPVRKAAEDEAARLARVKTGVMHGSGKGGGQQKISLTNAQRAAARQFGVSEDAYLASLQAMGGDI